MKPIPKNLNHPLSVVHFDDGEAYHLTDLKFVQTNLFFEIAFVDSIVVKTPSTRGRHDFKKFVKNEQKDWDDVRAIEESERFFNFPNLSNSFPKIKRVAYDFGPDFAHYLLVHKLQNERLKKVDLIAIPATCFVMLQMRRFLSISSWRPAIVQERVSGTSLWNMYDHENDVLHPKWHPLLPFLSKRLSNILGSPFRDHLNWNIQNLIYNETEQKLYYVDCTPSILFSRAINEHNIGRVKAVFIE